MAQRPLGRLFRRNNPAGCFHPPSERGQHREDNMSDTIIGILYPGEMGSTIGKLLAGAGFNVIATVADRSVRTERLCKEAGLRTVASIPDLLAVSDIVISLVPPSAALQVATEVATASVGSDRRWTYVDANSISPSTVADIAKMFRGRSIDFIDAAIFGLASQIRERGTVYVSGSQLEEVVGILGRIIRVRTAGDEPGQASALKMIVSGIPKGLSAMFIETLLFAQSINLLDQAIQAYDEIYPHTMEVVRRMLPTYPQHAGRRSQELQHVVDTMLSTGVMPRIVRAAQQVTSAVAEVGFDTSREWSLVELIQYLYEHNVLASPAAPGTYPELGNSAEEMVVP